MNLLLIRPDEIKAGVIVVHGRRAHHLISVLKVSQGTRLRAGVEGVGRAAVDVIAKHSDSVTLELSETSAVQRPATTLILALPRPKVISRVIAAAASFGLAKLILVNAWRVEKSYFSSARLQPQRIEEDLRLGCEQGAQCWVPEWEIWPRFTDLLAPMEAQNHERSQRIVLHPGASQSLADVVMGPAMAPDGPITLLVGPEGGWIPLEHTSLLEAHYVAAELGTGPLKTDVAVAAALGQLALIRSFSSSLGRAKLQQ